MAIVATELLIHFNTSAFAIVPQAAKQSDLIVAYSDTRPSPSLGNYLRRMCFCTYIL